MRTTATKGFAGRGTGGDPARLHAMSTRPTGSAVPEPLQAGRQGAAGGQPPPPPFRTLETNVRGKPDRHRAHSPAAPRPSTTGPRFPLWGQQGEPRSPRDATGGSRDGRQPHGAPQPRGEIPTGEARGRAAAAPRCLSPALPSPRAQTLTQLGARVSGRHAPRYRRLSSPPEASPVPPRSDRKRRGHRAGGSGPRRALPRRGGEPGEQRGET